MPSTRNKLCFLIGPIGSHNSAERQHADTLLKKIIKPTFANHFREFKVERADHIARPGMIDSQVITHLIDADLVIADITGRNANAFYELGIRHMLQKPVIHLYRRGDAIPMDIAPYRSIEFDYIEKSDVREAKIALRRAVHEVFLPGFIIENPVTRSAGFIRMQAAAEKKTPKKRNSRKRRPFGDPTPSIYDAPGVSWFKAGKNEFLAVWQPDPEICKRGFPKQAYRLWQGPKLSQGDKAWISDRSNVLQQEMLAWDHGIR
jgi:hypothetical protein